MKINIEIDATADEVRQTLGLNYLEKIQKLILSQTTKQIKDGTLDISSLANNLLNNPMMELGKSMLGSSSNSSKRKKK